LITELWVFGYSVIQFGSLMSNEDDHRQGLRPLAGFFCQLPCQLPVLLLIFLWSVGSGLWSSLPIALPAEALQQS